MAFLLAPPSRTLIVDHCQTGIIPRLELKDPNDVKNYVFALGEWLDAESTTLASYAVAIESPVGGALVKDSDASDAQPDADPAPIPGRNVCVWLSAGAAAVDYSVRLRAVTASGVQIDRSFVVPVRSL